MKYEDVLWDIVFPLCVFCPDKSREDWSFIRIRIGGAILGVWSNDTVIRKPKLHLKMVCNGKQKKISYPLKKHCEEILFGPCSPQVQICNYTLLFVSSVLQSRPVNCALKKKGFRSTNPRLLFPRWKCPLLFSFHSHQQWLLYSTTQPGPNYRLWEEIMWGPV